MASDMIKYILAVENECREAESKARETTQSYIEKAKAQGEEIIRAAVEQAEKEANIILSDAEYSAVGVVKQAEKLAELRERKSISDTEKLYDKAIDTIFDVILN